MSLIAVLVGTAVLSATGPCAVGGVVRDATGRPLSGVVVAAEPDGPVAATGEDGTYCLAAVPSTAVSLLVAAEGFLPVRAALTGGRPLALDVTLVPAFREDLLVTAARDGGRLGDSPVRTEVIGKADIGRIGARTLAEAVEFTTGVRVETNCQNCNFSQIRLLGLEGPYTQVLLDGQPVVSSLAAVYGIEQIPARMIERIEVVKGGGSALYGPGAVGGVINVIPREPLQSGGGVELGGAWLGGQGTQVAGGSADWVAPDRSAFVTVFGQFDRVPAVDLSGDGYTEVSRRRLAAGGLRAARFLLGQRARLTLDVSAIGEHRRGGNALDRPPHEADIAESLDTRQRLASLTWYHAPSATLDYRATLSWAGTWRDSYYGTGRDPDAYGDTTSRVVMADAQVNRYRGVHAFSVGGQAATEALVDSQPAYRRFTNQRSASVGLFVQDDWSPGRGWQIVTGARADLSSFLDRVVVSPRLAVMWSPYAGLDVRASASRGFRAPQVFDEDLHLSSVGGEARLVRSAPHLREERSMNLMAGLEWTPVLGAGQALVEANVFRTTLRDLFHVQGADDPATDEVEFERTNAGGARVYGVELNLGWGIGEDLVVQGGVVVQRARFDTPEPDFGSRDFFRTPDRYASLTARWAGPAFLSLFAGVRYTGPMRVPRYRAGTDRDLVRSPSFVTLDLGLARPLGAWGGRALTLTANLRNLTGAYQRDLDQGPLRDANYVYGPRLPRSIGMGLRVDF
ncbi:MAG: TonB-dependent receptor [Vicinamibacterales bacterium]